MLIYDLGFFNGDDTDYYLKKGFNVIAIEANKKLYEKGLLRFKKEIENKNLILLNNAYSNIYKNNENIIFFVNPENLDQSTCHKEKTTFWNIIPETHLIPSINLSTLFKNYGIPYYIKTDIEGFDYMVLEELLFEESLFSEINFHPVEYVSFELSRIDYYKIFCLLYLCGYKKFKLINQKMNEYKFDNEIKYQFDKYHSGFFGKDLFSDNYLSFDKCLTQYIKYKELKEIDNVNLALGWIDIHAAR